MGVRCVCEREGVTSTECTNGANSRVQERLTPSELRLRLEKNLTRIVEEYDEICARELVERVDLKVSRQLYRAGGECQSTAESPPTHEIIVSYPAYEYWGLDRVRDILRHEVAHAVVFEEFGPNVPSHGREFRTVANALGAPVRGEDRLPYRFELRCRACGQMVDGTYRSSVRTRNPGKYRSGCCDAPLESREKDPFRV